VWDCHFPPFGHLASESVWLWQWLSCLLHTIASYQRVLREIQNPRRVRKFFVCDRSLSEVSDLATMQEQGFNVEQEETLEDTEQS
jgi:hypothetical protein